MPMEWVVRGTHTWLRPLELDDMEAVADWRNERGAFDSFFSPTIIADSGQEAWYARYAADPTDQAWIIESEEGDSIGMVSLSYIDKHHQSAELGRTLIIPEARGNGYAADALRTLLRFGFREMNLHRIYLEVFAENKAAVRLYQECGFQTEGLMRGAKWKAGGFQDVLLMAVLSTEAEL